MCQYQWLPGCWVSVFWDILFLPSVSELIWPFPLPYKHLLPSVACVRATGDLRRAYLAKSDIASVNHFSKDTYRMQNGRNIHIDSILPKGPYPPCLRMADRALLTGYPRYMLICCNCFQQLMHRSLCNYKMLSERCNPLSRINCSRQPIRHIPYQLSWDRWNFYHKQCQCITHENLTRLIITQTVEHTISIDLNEYWTGTKEWI